MLNTRARATDSTPRQHALDNLRALWPNRPSSAATHTACPFSGHSALSLRADVYFFDISPRIASPQPRGQARMPAETGGKGRAGRQKAPPSGARQEQVAERPAPQPGGSPACRLESEAQTTVQALPAGEAKDCVAALSSPPLQSAGSKKTSKSKSKVKSRSCLTFLPSATPVQATFQQKTCFLLFLCLPKEGIQEATGLAPLTAKPSTLTGFGKGDCGCRLQFAHGFSACFPRVQRHSC